MSKRHALSILSLLFAMNMPAAMAQGISEYGGLLGETSNMRAPLGMRDMVQKTYNNATSSIGSSTSGGAASASHGTRQLDEDQVANYAAAAGREYNAAQAAIKKGDSSAALKHLETTISVRQSVWGKNDPYLGELFHQQGDLLQKLGKMADAINAYKKQLQFETHRYGDYSSQVEKTTQRLATITEQSGEPRDQSVFLKRLYAIQSRAGADSTTAKATNLKLCECLIFSGEYQAAEAQLKQAIDAQQGCKSPDQSYLAKLYDTYGGLLRETHRDAEAKDYEQRALAAKTAPSSN